MCAGVPCVCSCISGAGRMRARRGGSWLACCHWGIGHARAPCSRGGTMHVSGSAACVSSPMSAASMAQACWWCCCICIAAGQLPIIIMPRHAIGRDESTAPLACRPQRQHPRQAPCCATPGEQRRASALSRSQRGSARRRTAPRPLPSNSDVPGPAWCSARGLQSDCFLYFFSHTKTKGLSLS